MDSEIILFNMKFVLKMSLLTKFNSRHPIGVFSSFHIRKGLWTAVTNGPTKGRFFSFLFTFKVVIWNLEVLSFQ